MSRDGNMMGGTYLPHGDETFLKYFSRKTENRDHFVDNVTEKGY
jgi:hypothetical protein